jgi:hypothetical protein
MIPTKEQRDEIACLEQRSHDWFRARLGCVTGSCVSNITKPSEAEKALIKAISIGPLETEGKRDFNTRINPLKKTDIDAYNKALAEGPKKETKEEFESRIAKLQEAANASPFSEGTLTYLYELASERNLRDVFVKDEELFNQYLMRTSVSSNAIRWGEETEAMARLQYSRITGNEVAEIGFYRHPTVDWYGDSPDGSVVNKESGLPIGSIEIKCPKSQTWIEYRHKFAQIERIYNSYVKEYMDAHPEIDSDAFREDFLPLEKRLSFMNAEMLKSLKMEYYWQCQSHCECHNVDWCDFIVYDQMQKGEIIIVRIYRNQADIDRLLSRIKIANDYIENEILS